MGEDLPLIAQVSNVSALATVDQMEKLFGFMGKIKDIRMYPSVSVVQPQFKVCFIKYAESWSVRVALHMTNTVFIDRALVVVAIPGDSIPSEDSTSFDLLNPASALPALLSGFKDVSNDIAAVDGNLVITSVDTNLDILGLPQYPPLSADQDPNTIEEIRRTIYIENINPQVTASQLMDFMNNIVGEVKYLRMAGLDKNMLQSAFVEFTDRASIVKALQCDGITLKGNVLKIHHSSSAIVKPQKEAEVISEKDTEEAMKRLKEAESLIARVVEPEISGKSSSRSRRRSTSRSRRRSSSRSRRRSRSISRRSSRKRDKRSRSKERRRRSTSRRRKTRSRSRSKLRRSRSRSRPRRSRSRSKGRRSKRAERSYSRGRRSPSKSKISKKSRRSRSRSPRSRRGRRSRSALAASKRSRRSRSRSVSGSKRSERSRSKSRLSRSQRSRSRSRPSHSRRSKRSASKTRGSPKRERSRSRSKISSSGTKDISSKPKTSLSSSRSRSREPSPKFASVEENTKNNENGEKKSDTELKNSVAVSPHTQDDSSKLSGEKDEPSADTMMEPIKEADEVSKLSEADDSTNLNTEIPTQRSPTGESRVSDKESAPAVKKEEDKARSRSRSLSKSRSGKSDRRSPKKTRSRSRDRKRTRSPVRNIRRRRSYSSSDSSSPEVSRIRDKKSRSRHHSRSPRRSKHSSKRSVTPPKRSKRSPTPKRSKRSVSPSSSKYRSRDDKRKSRSRKRSTSRSPVRRSKSRSPRRSTTKEPGSDKDASSRAASSKETSSSQRARKGSCDSDARGSDSDV